MYPKRIGKTLAGFFLFIPISPWLAHRLVHDYPNKQMPYAHSYVIALPGLRSVSSRGRLAVHQQHISTAQSCATLLSQRYIITTLPRISELQ